jgi:hypothetical protein
VVEDDISYVQLMEKMEQRFNHANETNIASPIPQCQTKPDRVYR